MKRCAGGIYAGLAPGAVSLLPRKLLARKLIVEVDFGCGGEVTVTPYPGTAEDECFQAAANEICYAVAYALEDGEIGGFFLSPPDAPWSIEKDKGNGNPWK